MAYAKSYMDVVETLIVSLNLREWVTSESYAPTRHPLRRNGAAMGGQVTDTKYLRAMPETI